MAASVHTSQKRYFTDNSSHASAKTTDVSTCRSVMFQYFSQMVCRYQVTTPNS